MTTMVKIVAEHVPSGKKIEILRGGRVEATLYHGEESFETHVWDLASITVAEAPVSGTNRPPAPPTD